MISHFVLVLVWFGEGWDWGRYVWYENRKAGERKGDGGISSID